MLNSKKKVYSILLGWVVHQLWKFKDAFFMILFFSAFVVDLIVYDYGSLGGFLSDRTWKSCQMKQCGLEIGSSTFPLFSTL